MHNLMHSALLVSLVNIQTHSINSPSLTALKKQYITQSSMIDFSYTAFHSWDMAHGMRYGKKFNDVNNFDSTGSSEHNHQVIFRDAVIL